MLWFWLALLAAVMWSVCYVISERLMQNGLTPAGLQAGLSTVVLVATLIWLRISGEYKGTIAIFKKMDLDIKLLLLAGLCSTVGMIAINYSIKLKNATLTGMIEITYPLFTALLVWVVFKEVQASMGAFVGFFLIMAGIACIYCFER